MGTGKYGKPSNYRDSVNKETDRFRGSKTRGLVVTRGEVMETVELPFIAALETPVRRAVLALFENGELTGSSGFHHKLNQKWTIVLEGYASELVLEAARRSGLEVSYRGHVRWRYEIYTDVWLDGCGVDEQEKAREAFDRFADIYIELASVVKQNRLYRKELHNNSNKGFGGAFPITSP